MHNLDNKRHADLCQEWSLLLPVVSLAKLCMDLFSEISSLKVKAHS